MLDKFDFIYVSAVSKAHETGDPEFVLLEPVEHRCSDGAALADDGYTALPGEKRPGGAHGVVGVVYTLAIRPDQANSVLSRNLGKPFLEFLAFRTCLAESARDHDRPLYSTLAAILDRLGYYFRRDYHYGQINRIGNLLDILKTAYPKNAFSLRVYRIERARKTTLDQIFQYFVTVFSRIV